MNASQLKADSHIHALLIGSSGVGKTVAACSFPGRTFVLDFDDRIKGIMGCEWTEARRLAGEIEYERMTAWRGNKPQGIDDAYVILDLIDSRISKREITNVVLDSTGSMVSFFINYSLNRTTKDVGERAPGIKHHKLGSTEIPQKQDYNYTAICMRNIIFDNLKTFPCNVFISAHIKDKKIASPTTEDPDRVIVVGKELKAPGQLAIDIPSWLNETWELTVDDTITSQAPRRFVLFQSWIAKTTFQVGSWIEKNGKKEWTRTHRLDITGKSLYEALRPTFEKMNEASTECAKGV